MKIAKVLFALLFSLPLPALAGQAPRKASDPDLPISARDRVYTADQFSNTVSVVSPLDGKLLGVIRLGDPAPGNLSPLYRGQLLVHGLGVSPDQRTLAVVHLTAPVPCSCTQTTKALSSPCSCAPWL